MTSSASAASMPTSVAGTSTPPKRERASRTPTSRRASATVMPSSRTSTAETSRCCSVAMSASSNVEAGGGGAMPLHPRPRGLASLIDVPLDVDLLLADVARDRFLVGADILLETHALLWNRALLDDGPLLGQRHLVLLLADLGSRHRAVAVRIGDRLAFDPHGLTLHRHRLADRLRGHVLSQPRPARLAPLRTDVQLLLGARHRVVGRRPTRVPTHRARRDNVLAVGEAAVRAAFGVLKAVVPVQLALLVLGEVTVGLHARRILHLVLRVGDADRVTLDAGLLQRDEVRGGAEESALHQGKLRLVSVVVDVDLADRPDLVAVLVEQVEPFPGLHVPRVQHSLAPWSLVMCRGGTRGREGSTHPNRVIFRSCG